MKELVLGSGARVLLDSEDYARIAAHRWHINHYGYPVRFEGSSRKRTQKVIWLHREVMRAADGTEVDHRFHNLLDARKGNLRLVTRQQNCFNQAKARKSSSKYKGVFWFKRDQCWAAQICVGGRRKHLGYFASEESAARAYNAAAQARFGKFAWLNVVTESSVVTADERHGQKVVAEGQKPWL